MFTIEKSAGARIVSRAGKIACAVLATASVTLFAGAAFASNDVPEKRVSFADLNLSKQQDTKVLYERLMRASRDVCSSLDGRSLKEITQYNECFKRALSEAVERVGSGTLSALHDTSRPMRVAKMESAG